MSKIVFLVDTSFLNSDSLKLEHIFATKIMQYFDINLGKFFYYNFFDCFENNIFFENSIIYYYVSYQRVDELVEYIWNYDNAIYCCHVIIIHENNGPEDDSLLKINYNEIIKRATPKGILIPSIIVSEDKTENLLKFISVNVKKYIKKCTKKNVKKISLKNLWVVRQFKNEYNPIHFHSGNISGVGYLKIPKNITKSRKRLKTNGTIDFIHGSKSFLNNSLFNHNPIGL